jgi:hypothetical protein
VVFLKVVFQKLVHSFQPTAFKRCRMSNEQETGYVNYTNDNGIAIIEFYHPQSNSLPAALLKQLAATIESAGKHATANVIVLRSTGDKAFCAGASFDELMAIGNEAEGLAFFQRFRHVDQCHARLSKIYYRAHTRQMRRWWGRHCRSM